MTLEEFIEKLYAAGWKAPCDAQHTKIKELWEELRCSGMCITVVGVVIDETQ